MTVNFGAWMQGGGGWVQAQTPLRAQIEWARILDNPTDIQLNRDGTLLDPQTVRIELSTGLTETSGATGMSFVREVIIFGVRGHPEIDDFDVRIWDTFVMEDGEYTINNVNRQIQGHIQAHAERVG